MNTSCRGCDKPDSTVSTQAYARAWLRRQVANDVAVVGAIYEQDRGGLKYVEHGDCALAGMVSLTLLRGWWVQ